MGECLVFLVGITSKFNERVFSDASAHFYKRFEVDECQINCRKKKKNAASINSV